MADLPAHRLAAADYKGQPGFRGKGRYSDTDLQAMVDTCGKYGWQMGLHAIGDAASCRPFNAYAAALKKYPRQDHRWFCAISPSCRLKTR